MTTSMPLIALIANLYQGSAGDVTMPVVRQLCIQMLICSHFFLPSLSFYFSVSVPQVVAGTVCMVKITHKVGPVDKLDVCVCVCYCLIREVPSLVRPESSAQYNFSTCACHSQHHPSAL
jgi:hypothetical protein